MTVFFCLFKGRGAFYEHLQHLSFTPWPEPNHVRPFQAKYLKGDVITLAPMGSSQASMAIIVEDEKEGYIRSHIMSVFDKDSYEVVNHFRPGVGEISVE